MSAVYDPETVTAGPGWVVRFGTRLPCPAGPTAPPERTFPRERSFTEWEKRCQLPEPMPRPDGRAQHLRGARWRQ